MSDNQPSDDNSLELQMIEYCLGLLPEQEHKQFARRLSEDAELRARYQELSDPLHTLNDYHVEVPKDLRGRILSSSRMSGLIRRQQEAELPAKEKRSRLTLPWVLREFSAAAAAIVIILSTWAVTANHARQQQYKALCGSQLAGMGTGLANYQIDHPGQLPQIRLAEGDSWYDFDKKKPRRQHLFLLVKMKYVDPKLLACPAAKVRLTLTPQDLDELSDFPDSIPVTYSFQNLYGDHKFSEEQRRQRWAHPAHMAVMADQTPLLSNEGLQPVLSPQSQSPNHRTLTTEGQNVLFLDGSALWKTAPLVGPQEDNIWQAGQLDRYHGNEVPSRPDDSFLTN